MPQCTYGTQVKAGAPLYVWIAWDAFLSWLASHYSRLGTLTQIWFADAPLLVTDFCAEEPTIPAFPSIPTWASAFGGDGIAALEVGDYLRSLFISTIWPTVCECAPSAGTGTCNLVWPSSHSFSNAYAGGSGAFELGNSFHSLVSATCYGADVWRNGAPTGGVTSVTLWDTSTGLSVYGQSFTGQIAGHARLMFTTPQVLVTNRVYIISYCKANADGYYQEAAGSPGNNAEMVYDNKLYTATCGQRPTTDPTQWSAINPLVCAGGPPSVPGPPYTPPAPQDPTDIPDNPNATCTTTADLCTATTRILAAVATAERQINWVQSALAPNCWIPGTPATGLSGTGTLAASDIVGVFADCSVPTRWGRSSETPPRYIPEIGSVEFTTDGVATVRYGLHYAQENIIRAVPSNNGIRYNLRAGVTASLTALHRCK